jgi:hypothetical protein
MPVPAAVRCSLFQIFQFSALVSEKEEGKDD